MCGLKIEMYITEQHCLVDGQSIWLIGGRSIWLIDGRSMGLIDGRSMVLTDCRSMGQINQISKQFEQTLQSSRVFRDKRVGGVTI